ncbi:Biotin-requiring enzyme [Paenibacillus sp. 1_12]|uniref:biotin/lipoyl-containing protein n=1 Tax=Paenibacillus sp. 1_12 TaxID=1566278 RepID=UPI0008EBD229|nr:biotin/lipoyl-containing protein [Paenibacillus sp. 1_12]SFL58044.1 Biotin-requiring enzyme [Paenibacillus sp. 1_12]
MFKVIIPKMGMSTVEVDIVNWFVAVGDEVSISDPLAEVESEKSNFTIESEVNGVVTEILVELYATVDVGTVICTIQPKS